MDLLIKITIQNVSVVMLCTHVANTSNYETTTYLTYGRTYFNNETGKITSMSQNLFRTHYRIEYRSLVCPQT